MAFEIRREDSASLAEYASIPIAFEVRHVVATPSRGLAASAHDAHAVAQPYVKDYDALNPPHEWDRRFDVRRALFVVAFEGRRRLGGAVIIVDAADAARLGADDQFALLWDLRVAPEARRRGVGRSLLAAAEASAREAGLRGIVVETQDINLAACRLYAATGYALSRITPLAYPQLPNETLLVWTKSFL